MVTEGLLLSSLGGLAGLRRRPVGHARVRLAPRSRRRPAAATSTSTFDLNVFLFSLGAAVVTGVAIGLWPAWRASRADARAALHDGGKGQSDGADRQRLRRLLVVGQISGALALLVVAGLFVRTLTSAAADGSGLRRRASDHGAARSEADRLRRRPDERVLQGAAAARAPRGPTSTSVAVAFTTPMSYLIGGGSIYIEGQPVPASASRRRRS